MVKLRSVCFVIFFYSWLLMLALITFPVLFLPPQYLYRVQVLMSRSMVFLLRYVVGLRFEIRGQEYFPEGPALLAMKHQSAWETMVMHGIISKPVFVMKKELLRIPIYGRYCKKSGMIPVDRGGAASALRDMVRKARNAIAEGKTIIIFPEGTRVAPGTKRPYHAGVFGIYKTCDVPAVPVTLNSGTFWPRGHLLQRPGVIVLEFLPPIEPGLKKKDFMALLESRIEEASDALQEAEDGKAQDVSAPRKAA